MTTMRRDGSGTPFGEWLRTNPRLDSINDQMAATDVDMWVHKYSPRAERRRTDNILDFLDLLMLVEVKTFNAELSYSQRDTLEVVDQYMRKPSIRKNVHTGPRRQTVQLNETRISHLFRTKRPMRWYGVHLLQLSDSRPDSSDVILWDKKQISEERLIGLLRFDFDPAYPERRIDTRRHHVVKSIEECLPLLQLIKGGR
jgi:hypothetical protein